MHSVLVSQVGLGSPPRPRNKEVPPGSPVSPEGGATRPVSALRAAAEGSHVLLLLRCRPRALAPMEMCRPGRGEDPSAPGAAAGGGWGESPLSPWCSGDNDVCAVCVMGALGCASRAPPAPARPWGAVGPPHPRCFAQGEGPRAGICHPGLLPVPVPEPQFPSGSATIPREGGLTSGSFTPISAFTPGTNLLRPAGKERELRNQQKLWD